MCRRSAGKLPFKIDDAVFLRLEAGVGAKLVSGIPEAFFRPGVAGVFCFGWGDHEAYADVVYIFIKPHNQNT